MNWLTWLDIEGGRKWQSLKLVIWVNYRGSYSFTVTARLVDSLILCQNTLLATLWTVRHEQNTENSNLWWKISYTPFIFYFTNRFTGLSYTDQQPIDIWMHGYVIQRYIQNINSMDATRLRIRFRHFNLCFFLFNFHPSNDYLTLQT